MPDFSKEWSIDVKRCKDAMPAREDARLKTRVEIKKRSRLSFEFFRGTGLALGGDSSDLRVGGVSIDFSCVSQWEKTQERAVERNGDKATERFSDSVARFAAVHFAGRAFGRLHTKQRNRKSAAWTFS